MERGINWHLIAFASVLPLLVGFAVALPFWKRNNLVVGNTVGLFVMFVGFLFFAGSEYADALKFRYWCAETQTPCPPTGSGDFLRIAAFGMIAMVQAAAIYVASGDIERRASSRHYKPRWRR
jgi:hypothetical protein